MISCGATHSSIRSWAQIGELELLLVEPDHELDRLADQRPGVLHRGGPGVAVSLHGLRELMRDLPRRVGADMRTIGPGRALPHRRGVPGSEPGARFIAGLEDPASHELRTDERDRVRRLDRGLVKPGMADQDLAGERPAGLRSEDLDRRVVRGYCS